MDGARQWRTRAARYSLLGAYCGRCDKPEFPPRPRCPRCGHETTEFAFSGRGTVYSYSVVRQGPDGFADQVPYVVALVALEEGPLLAAQLTDVEPGELRIGQPVEMVTRRLRDDGPQGTVLYSYKFRPPRGWQTAPSG
ncbi:MAG: Zn-ribbon domain-containing OB-fold protein [Polyangiaceae bacterium]|nr:Zn-ribbon domain-containing OB-fold protein [Polyangiaceae bacterium]